MHILQVHNRYAEARGGEDVVADAEYELLTTHGHKVSRYIRDNADVLAKHAWAKFRHLISSHWSRHTITEFRELLRRERPDIVHVHNLHYTITASLFQACRLEGVPVVQTLHNYRYLCASANFFRNGRVCTECLEHGRIRGLVHGCYRGSRTLTGIVTRNSIHAERMGLWTGLVDRFIALTEFARRQFITYGVPSERITVKPNFAADSGIGDHAGEFALFVGRWSQEKGVEILIPTWERIARNIPLLVVGPGQPSDRRPYERVGIQLLGSQDRTLVLELMKSAKCLIFPSLWFEGMPMTILEAFATGLPVIASRLGAMPELVTDGANGILFTPGCVDELASAVERLCSDRKLSVRMGQNARAFYESHYSPRANYELLLQVYEDVIVDGARGIREYEQLYAPET